MSAITARDKRREKRLREAEQEEFLWLIRNARAPMVRTILQWACEEFIVPDGPYKGMRFRVEVQPFAGLWLQEVGSNKWKRFIFVGPRQVGKTMLGWVIPTLYTLFELNENVTLGIPDGDMFADKWKQDLRPAIELSKYVALMPTRGAGSKGGEFGSIEFQNNATLKAMTGGGGDQNRAGYTARTFIATEVDKLDRSSPSSPEADKLSQMEHVTDSYDEDARIFLECTLTTEKGRSWREYKNSTASRIAVQCVHEDCREWVTPEREHLRGWQEANTVNEARRNAYFICPACGKAWTNEQRIEMNRKGRLVHAGQKIDKNTLEIIGEEPDTDTFGLRINAFNNLFWTSGSIAAREWRSARDPDSDNAERNMRQAVWAIPHEPEEVDLSEISIAGIKAAVSNYSRGIVPSRCTTLVAAIDLGKHLLHWTAAAFDDNASIYVVDYGAIESPAREMAEERAVLLALREFYEICERGWKLGDEMISPELVLVDAAGGKHIVAGAYAFVREAGPRYLASKGYGISQGRVSNVYHQPRKVSADVRRIGDNYHISRQRDPRPGIDLVHVNDDYWKSWLHARIRAPRTEAGSFHLFQPVDSAEHIRFAKHLAAEREEERFDPRRGRYQVWVSVQKANHYLDAMKLCCVAGHMCGVRLVRSETSHAEHQMETDWFANRQQQRKSRPRWLT